MTILLTQLNSGQDRITHLINTSSTLLLPVTWKCQDLNLWFVVGVVWPVVKVPTQLYLAGIIDRQVRENKSEQM